jgi:alpha-tubulin suppressor-like RCC1 family protein
VSNFSSASALAAGASFTCALDANGKAYCWGQNTYGQLGNSGTTDSLIPVPVSGF